MHHTVGARMREDLRQGIDDCLACSRMCQETVGYCLEAGGHHAEAPHIRLLLDSARLAESTAGLMLRGSEFVAEAAALCATVATRCAQDCEGFGDDSQMQACAEVCRRCATSCHQVVQAQRAA